MLTGLTFSVNDLFICLSLKFNKTLKKKKILGLVTFFFVCVTVEENIWGRKKKKRRDVDRSKEVRKSAIFHFHFAKQLKRLVCCLYLKIKSKNSSFK